MARECDICVKGTKFGNKVTFSHRRLNRNFKPNVHKLRAKINGSVKTINVCTKCIKSGKVEKA